MSSLNLELEKQASSRNKLNNETSFMQFKVDERNSEMQQMNEKLQYEMAKNNQLSTKLATQEVEVQGLIACIDTLRKQVIKYTKATQKDPLESYEKFNKMIEMYQGSEQLLSKIKNEKRQAVKKNLLDMQLERVRLQTEMEMLDKAIYTTNQHYAVEMGASELAEAGKSSDMGFTRGFSNQPNATGI